jgi:single-strand DNA-binding protein
VNVSIYTGRIGSDPEIKTTSTGKQVCSLRLAADSGVKPKEGSQQPPPVWLTVIAWQGLAEACKALHKGDLVVVVGKQSVRQYKTQDGQQKTIYEVTAECIAVDLRTLAKRHADQATSTIERVFEGKEDLGDLNIDDLPF